MKSETQITLAGQLKEHFIKNGWVSTDWVVANFKSGYDCGKSEVLDREKTLVKAVKAFMKTRKIVNKEADWDAFDDLEEVISNYPKKDNE